MGWAEKDSRLSHIGDAGEVLFAFEGRTVGHQIQKAGKSFPEKGIGK